MLCFSALFAQPSPVTFLGLSSPAGFIAILADTWSASTTPSPPSSDVEDVGLNSKARPFCVDLSDQASARDSAPASAPAKGPAAAGSPVAAPPQALPRGRILAQRCFRAERKGASGLGQRILPGKVQPGSWARACRGGWFQQSSRSDSPRCPVSGACQDEGPAQIRQQRAGFERYAGGRQQQQGGWATRTVGKPPAPWARDG